MEMNPLPIFTGSEKSRTIFSFISTFVPLSIGVLLINVGLVRSALITSNSVVIPRF